MDRISPVSAAASAASVFEFVEPGRPKTDPRVGTKISAIKREPVSVVIRVRGRYFINSPTTPGQNISGMKTARVVAVDAMIGQAMRLAARA